MGIFDAFTPHAYELFSSMMDEDDQTAIPVGLSPLAKNVQFHSSSVKTRDGIAAQWGMSTKGASAIGGLASLDNLITETQVPMVADQSGHLFYESPVGSGHLIPISSPQVTIPAGPMQITPAYLGAYIAPSNLINSLGFPFVYNLQTTNLDPLSMKPVGVQWSPQTAYVVGEVVTGIVGGNGFGNGHTFRCTTAGTSGSHEPGWNPATGSTTADNTVVWTEETLVFAQLLPQPQGLSAVGGTPLIVSGNIPASGFRVSVTRSAGAGSFSAGRDVYLAITLTTANGETDPLNILVFTNTVMNDRFVATVAQTVIAQFAPFATGWNLYEADVATGTGAPALSAYQLVASGLSIVATTSHNVDTTAVGVAPPTANGAALIATAGNAPAGTRWAVVLYVNRNGYISGTTTPAAINCNIGTTGQFQIDVFNIPLGPTPYTAARIIAFTAAGASSGGPYFYIPVNDVANGVQITATIINDNTTTSATFNFTDTYLQGLLGNANVTGNFRIIQVPPCSDVRFSRSLQRMIYKADSQPDGFYISLLNNPEAIFGDTSLVQVAQGNGERAITSREFRNQPFLFKERSGHIISPNAGDPSTFTIGEKWTSVGPCGPRAVDVSSQFMIFAHRSGAYVYSGDRPYWISKEIRKNWDQINWAFQQLIWVHIDDERKEIRIGVPFGQSTVVNKVFKCNFEMSHDPTVNEMFAPPFHMAAMTGKIIASVLARKWSIDDISASIMIRAERTLANPAPDLPNAFIQTQLLVGSSNADGSVSAIFPGTYNDNGNGIDSVYECSAHNMMFPVNQLGGVQASITGSGDTFFEVVFGRSQAPEEGGVNTTTKGPQFVRLKKTFNPENGDTGYECGARGNNERMRLRFHNNKTPNAWFDVSWACIFAKKISGARTK